MGELRMRTAAERSGRPPTGRPVWPNAVCGGRTVARRTGSAGLACGVTSPTRHAQRGPHVTGDSLVKRPITPAEAQNFTEQSTLSKDHGGVRDITVLSLSAIQNDAVIGPLRSDAAWGSRINDSAAMPKQRMNHTRASWSLKALPGARFSRALAPLFWLMRGNSTISLSARRTGQFGGWRTRHVLRQPSFVLAAPHECDLVITDPMASSVWADNYTMGNGSGRWFFLNLQGFRDRSRKGHRNGWFTPICQLTVGVARSHARRAWADSQSASDPISNPAPELACQLPTRSDDRRTLSRKPSSIQFAPAGQVDWRPSPKM